MAAPQGIIYFANNPTPVMSGSFTLCPGVTPSHGTLEWASYFPPPARGDLTIVYGNQTPIVFKDCLCDMVNINRGDDGVITWRLTIYDRRVYWTRLENTVDGHWNVSAVSITELNPRVVEPLSEKTPQELVEMCLLALGETSATFDISLVPNDVRPEVNWDETPAVGALSSLLEDLNCVCCLGPADNKIYIVPLGHTTLTFTSEGALSFDASIDPSDPPPRIRIVGNKTKYQHDFRLEPVLLEVNGKWVHAENASYRPPTRERVVKKDGFKITIGVNTYWSDPSGLPGLEYFTAARINEKHYTKLYYNRAYRIMPYSSVNDTECTFSGVKATPSKTIPLQDNDRIGFYAMPVVSADGFIESDFDVGWLPTDLLPGTIYFVKNYDSSSGSFEVTKTLGGPSIDLSGSSGKCFCGSPIANFGEIIADIRNVEILGGLVEQEPGDDAILRPKPNVVWGRFENGEKVFTDDDEQVLHPSFVSGDGMRSDGVIKVSFSVDSNTGVVLFSEQVSETVKYRHKIVSSGRVYNYVAQESCKNLFIRVGCHVRGRNNKWDRYEYGNGPPLFPTPIPNSQVRTVQKPDIQRTVFDEHPPSPAAAITHDNAPICQVQADYYWKQEYSKYVQKDALTVVYAGFRLAGTDGQIMQVNWSVGTDGVATTTISRNREDFKRAITYKQRREIENRKYLAAVQQAAIGVANTNAKASAPRIAKGMFG